ncbi:phage/plasmid primase, P4 family, partial [Acidisphaera rubrifaciens]|uniref:phage/plasmid primase, P4 family n=1 Tax=Acidisphaera rubrifaciens TaxID=50715 RepID=UPI00066267CF
DADLVRFLQRAAGYALTGSTREHALFFGYGTGGNGKGVFLNTLAGIFGDYATIAPMETFAATQTDRHPTELAMLRGARLVTAQETEQGRAWAESRIKSLTGGDPITARFMHKDFFTFTPQFKLFIAGNHKPALRNVDEAMRRRMHLIPFTVTIPPDQRNPNLGAELKAEWPAILAWAIAGCLDWQRNGLAAPAAVTAATEEYLKGEDAFGQWVDECCEVGRHREEGSSALYAAWRTWAERAGEQPGTQKRFSQSLLERGYQACRLPNGKAAFRGIGLPIPRPRHETAADRD